MIFRWSFWGSSVVKNIELLRYSVLSFRKQFGDNHQYLVYTDNMMFIAEHLYQMVDIRPFPSDKTSHFYVRSKATWLKWCPSSRLDITQTEFYVDSDVFLLQYPKEIDLFLTDPKRQFAILDEFLGQPWQRGAMRKRATADTPYVNAGLFIQKAGYDISAELVKEFLWWQENIAPGEATHHDEQGALAIALTGHYTRGSLCILPKESYILIGETENAAICDLTNVTLIHAVYPNHPAFYRFKRNLTSILCKP
jgi:hypothetical protein